MENETTVGVVETPGPSVGQSTDDIKRDIKRDAIAIKREAAKLIPQYGAVECEAALGSVSEKYGRKSIAVVRCLVPISGIGMKLDATLWGQLVTKSDGTEITFSASLPKGIKASSAADRDRFLAHVENSCVRWAGYEKATAAAEAELLGMRPKVAKGDPAARPRLVKQVKLAAKADSAA
jgi:hypothetical protein